jgi:hypothetical protein
MMHPAPNVLLLRVFTDCTSVSRRNRKRFLGGGPLHHDFTDPPEFAHSISTSSYNKICVPPFLGRVSQSNHPPDQISFIRRVSIFVKMNEDTLWMSLPFTVNAEGERPPPPKKRKLNENIEESYVQPTF